MQISEQGLALIKQFEGFSATAYLCPAGKATIGYGHVIGAGEQFPGEEISREAAETLLKQDISYAELAISRLVQINLSQCQLDALLSFIFNVGSKAFEKSTLLQFLNQNQLEKAANEFLKWVYAGGRKIEGLARRRATERDFFLKDAIFTKL